MAMRIIAPKDLKVIMDKNEQIFIIDIREPEKFQAGHITGSVNIFQKDVPQNIDRIPREGMVVIACTYGMKSDQVYIYLREKHKFSNLYILEGGLYDWARDVDTQMTAL
jgi:sulfur-carrier protein adenylyltransferase/sulfurtransferase